MAYDFEKERNEAIAAGERALTSLRAAREELRSAGNWGLVDLFGGGMISGLVKHSKMGNAQRYMEQAKLARFLLRKKVKGDERYGKHNSGITW